MKPVAIVPLAKLVQTVRAFALRYAVAMQSFVLGAVRALIAPVWTRRSYVNLLLIAPRARLPTLLVS